MNRFSRVARRVLAGAVLTTVAALTATLVVISGSAGASASTPRCRTGGLEVWLGLGDGGAAMGSTYYPMEFTNVSGHTCYLYGYPGVSALREGHQVGSPAIRVASAYGPERTVTLAPGATAHVVLQVFEVANFPASRCEPVTADALRVYPPGAYLSTLIPFTFRACSLKGPVYLAVDYMRPHAGIPGHPGL